MKPDPNVDPQLFVINAEEMPLSGQALLELMQGVLARGKPFRFRARGWSMSPFIRDGDVITVSPIPRSLPATGDVVAFIRPGSGSLVVHRVVARGSHSALIQGDKGLEYLDGIIPRENLLGRVTRVERNGHRTWSGLGPERRIIAWLSAAGLLTHLRTSLAVFWKPFCRRCR